MNLNVSNVSFCGSTRNWGARGKKAPNKLAKITKKSAKQGKNVSVELSPRFASKLKSIEGLSLKEIYKIFPKYY